MSVDENKAFVRRYLEEVFDKGRLDMLDEFASESFKPGVVELVNMLRTALPDFRLAVEDVIAEGDRVVTHETLRGTHTGMVENPRMGRIVPTGRQVKWTRVAIRRISNGRLVGGFYGVKLRGEADELALLEHLAFVPRLGDAKRSA